VARTTRQSGFTLVELMIALLLTSMLLAAIATAMHAAMIAHEENTEIAAMTQAARVLMQRMRREIRTAAAVNHGAPSNELVIYPPDDGSGLQLIRYVYTGATRTLTCQRIVNGSAAWLTVFDSSSDVTLSTFRVTHDVAQDDQGISYTRRAVVQVTFVADNQSTSMTCSAAPRRNQSY
jgi:prepilin-type N-terminal cleavage/methylation domain-containing protein